MRARKRPPEPDVLARVAERYAVAMPAGAENLPADNPVARQYHPDIREDITLPDESGDPIGDDRHSPVKGVVHRHADRVLLKLTHACAVYCRFCFRREMVGPGGENILKPAERAAALNYIRAHPEIQEVILTGGDPLVLSPRLLKDILDELDSIDHIKVLRVHTRVPVAAPGCITSDLCAALKREKAVYVAIHVNHAQEITPEARRAFADLRAADCVLLSQSVLLRGVNDDPAALEELFRTLVALRVKPYYLHHPDRAPGTSHFRVGIARAQDILRRLTGRVSGLCLPHYMLDIPGGYGKIPVGPCWHEQRAGGVYTLTDPAGQTHIYRDDHDES